MDQEIIEYLLVGDSFTHGDCVNRPNDIASVLRTLSGKSVLNLGQPGNGPLIEYATLREYLNPNVKKVLWIFYEEDLQDLDGELKNEILINYLNDLSFTQNLKSKQNVIDDVLSKMVEGERNTFLKFLKLNRIRTTLYIYFVDKSQPYIQLDKQLAQTQQTAQLQPQLQPQPEFKKILELVKDLTSKNKSKLYFVFLTSSGRYLSANPRDYLPVKKIVNELNIPFIDIHTELFEKEQNPLKLFPFELGPHYTVEGYRKVAETIHKFTKN